VTAPALICATLEVALNRYLRLERSALDECAALDGKALAVQISDLGWTFIIEPHAGGVRVAASLEREPDVRVTAPSLRLAKLALHTARGAPGLPAGLDVQGDTELLAHFNALLTRVGFDPEELAAKFVGDAAAHRVVGGIKNLFGFGRTAVQRLSLDTAEYLTEETEDLARAADVSEWMEAVDQLREGADRLEARLLRLERAAGGSA
jgi:ubiquinone biosynthesis protein UbiJ